MDDIYKQPNINVLRGTIMDEKFHATILPFLRVVFLVHPWHHYLHYPFLENYERMDSSKALCLYDCIYIVIDEEFSLSLTTLLFLLICIRQDFSSNN